MATFVLIASSGSAQTLKQIDKECASLLDQESAVYDTEDWPQLERLAKRELEHCAVLGDGAVASAYSNLAHAHKEMGQLQLALDESQKCIEKNYTSLDCHTLKAQLLMELRRTKEALSQCEIVDKLASHIVETLSGGPASEDAKARIDEINSLRSNLRTNCHLFQVIQRNSNSVK